MNPYYAIAMHYKCPICGQTAWKTRPSTIGSGPAKSRVLDETFVDELSQAFENAYSGKENSTPEKTSLLDGVVVCECQACGYIALFNYDRVKNFIR